VSATLARRSVQGVEVVVPAAADLDVYHAGAFRSALIDLSLAGCHRVVVDLSETAYLDSTGLGVLIGQLKRVRARDGALAVVVPAGRDDLLKVFMLTGLLKVLNVMATVEDAVDVARDPA
jgi:anti-sigma B factor antagonist